MLPDWLAIGLLIMLAGVVGWCAGTVVVELWKGLLYLLRGERRA